MKEERREGGNVGGGFHWPRKAQEEKRNKRDKKSRKEKRKRARRDVQLAEDSEDQEPAPLVRAKSLEEKLAMAQKLHAIRRQRLASAPRELVRPHI